MRVAGTALARSYVVAAGTSPGAEGRRGILYSPSTPGGVATPGWRACAQTQRAAVGWRRWSKDLNARPAPRLVCPRAIVPVPPSCHCLLKAEPSPSAVQWPLCRLRCVPPRLRRGQPCIGLVNGHANGNANCRSGGSDHMMLVATVTLTASLRQAQRTRHRREKQEKHRE